MILNNIYILGFMASGKTKKGRKIAKYLDMNFLDLDEFIEEKEKKSINNIFEENGEKYFRNLETDFLLNNKLENTVISLGGGTPCFNNNIDLINIKGVSIYFELPIGMIIERLIRKKAKRPLIKDLDNFEINKKVNSLFNDRKKYYEKADIIIDAKKGYSKMKIEIKTKLIELLK